MMSDPTRLQAVYVFMALEFPPLLIDPVTHFSGRYGVVIKAVSPPSLVLGAPARKSFFSASASFQSTTLRCAILDS